MNFKYARHHLDNRICWVYTWYDLPEFKGRVLKKDGEYFGQTLVEFRDNPDNWNGPYPTRGECVYHEFGF